MESLVRFSILGPHNWKGPFQRNQGTMEQCEDKRKGWIILFMCQEIQKNSKSYKGIEIKNSPKQSQKKQPLWQLDISLIRLILDFWFSRL